MGYERDVLGSFGRRMAKAACTAALLSARLAAYSILNP